LQAIADVSVVFGTTKDADKILNLVVEKAVETMERKAAGLFMPGEGTEWH